jgi:hypothetical protein
VSGERGAEVHGGARPVPSHPVTVRLSLATGEIVIQAHESQIRSLVENLAARGVDVVIDSHGLCG